jgi:hypothetical protein
MRKGRHIVLLALVLILASITCAFAAGFERVPITGQAPAASGTNARTVSGFVDAVKDASLFDKCPPMIDEAAGTVKAILGQFGLTGPRNP